MKDGFEIFPRLFDAVEMETLAREVGAASLSRSRAGIRHLLNLPAIAALARDSRLMKLASEKLGSQPIPFGATLFDKSNEANWLVVWHQDTALPLIERCDAPGWGPWSRKGGVVYAHAPAIALQRIVALRIHVDDFTFDNGPLRVLPGTHTMGVLIDQEVHVLARHIDPVACTVDRGGVLVMRPLLVHASSKVNTPGSRRVIHIEYAATSVFEQGVRLRAA